MHPYKQGHKGEKRARAGPSEQFPRELNRVFGEKLPFWKSQKITENHGKSRTRFGPPNHEPSGIPGYKKLINYQIDKFWIMIKNV